MAFSIHNDVLDAALNYIKNNCNEVTICSAEPTTYTQAHTTYKLADVAVDSADFTVADGDVSGRKVTLAQQTGVTVDTTGTGTYMAWNDTVNSKLLYVKPVTSQSLTASNTITIPANDYEIKDPVEG